MAKGWTPEGLNSRNRPSRAASRVLSVANNPSLVQLINRRPDLLGEGMPQVDRLRPAFTFKRGGEWHSVLGDENDFFVTDTYNRIRKQANLLPTVRCERSILATPQHHADHLRLFVDLRTVTEDPESQNTALLELQETFGSRNIDVEIGGMKTNGDQVIPFVECAEMALLALVTASRMQKSFEFAARNFDNYLSEAVQLNGTSQVGS